MTSFLKSKIYYIEYIFIILWTIILKFTKFYFRQFYSTYLFCGILGLFCVFFIHKKNIKIDKLENKFNQNFLRLFSLLFSIIIISANYQILFPLNFLNITKTVILFFGSYLIWKYVTLMLLWTIISITNKNTLLKTVSKKTELKLFFFSFTLMFTVYIICLFLFSYPTNLYPDSLWQIDQAITGIYTNHHPFWHTMILKLCINLGNLISPTTVVFGLLIYSILQIFIMALIFSYSIITIYKAIPLKSIAFITTIFFTFVPYNIIYSFSLWKDTLFAGTLTLFITALFRIIRKIGNRTLNYVFISIGALGFAILRNNGFLAIVLTFLIFLIFFRKNYTYLKAIILFVIIISFVLTNPLLKYLNVQPTESGESLSIPTQQIARVVYDNYQLNDDQINLIEKVIKLEDIKTSYLPYISDPIKAYVNNSEYFTKNKNEYLKLWIQIGLKYPTEYIKAWIDQTVGYWSGGYDYWVWHFVWKDIKELDIKVSDNTFFVRKFLDKYTSLTYLPFIQLIYCIGFNFWIILMLFSTSVIRRKKEFILTIPIIAIILTLMIATPVFCEFRYAYALFTCLPIIFTGCMFTENKEP